MLKIFRGYIFILRGCVLLCISVLLDYGCVIYFGDRNQKRPAWSLHCKENVIVKLETVEKEFTFLRQLYRLVQVTLEL